MSERDELRDELTGWPIGSGYYSTSVGSEEAGEMADAILAAGYRKPRTVTTAAELDALRVGSVVLDDDGDAFQKSLDYYNRPQWYCVGVEYAMSAGPTLPATVLN